MVENHNTVIVDSDRLGTTNVKKNKKNTLLDDYFRIASIWPDVTQSNSSAELGFRSAF